MERARAIQGSVWNILWAGVILSGLYLTSFYNYLLFHSLSEFFAIAIACGMFMVAWNSRKYQDNGYFLILGVAYLHVAGIDLIHTLAYKGMPVFKGYGANLPTQLWIAARYLQGLSLLTAPLFIRWMPNPLVTFGAYLGISGLTVTAIFQGFAFPDCYVEGVGLTRFKVVSEYVICLILLGAVGLLYRRRSEFEGRVYVLLTASILTTIGAELAFTYYVNVYGPANLMGHLLKIVAFYLMYLAVIETALVAPYGSLFRNLKKKEEELRAGEERFRAIADYTYAWESWIGPRGELLWVNPAVERVTGYTVTECMAMAEFPFPMIHQGDQERLREIVGQALRKRTTGADVQFRIRRKDGPVTWMAVSWQPIYDSNGGWLGFRSSVHDITKRKRAEEELQIAYQELEARVRERTAEISAANEQLKKEIAERKRSVKALEQSEEELHRLSSRLFRAQEEERKVLSRDLHDGIGQSLSAIKFGLERALVQMGNGEAGEAIRSLESLIPLTGQAIEEVRRTQKGLRPPVLDDLGILPTLSWFCRECEGFYEDMRIHLDVAVQEDDVPEALKIVLFRVLQEAVNNAAKHARAQEVRIRLALLEGALEFTVSDNGRGFNPEKTGSLSSEAGGLGLTSMKERVDLSGGGFYLESQEGVGTTIRAKWPLRREGNRLSPAARKEAGVRIKAD